MVLPKCVFPRLRDALAEEGIELTNEQLEVHLVDFCGPFELVDLDCPLDERWFDYAAKWIKRDIQK